MPHLSHHIGRLAIFFGILMIAIPLVIGALNESWAAAIAFAVLPWFPAIILGANAILAPTNTSEEVSPWVQQ